MLTKKTTRWSRWGLPAFLAVAVVTSGNLHAQDEEELEAFAVTGTRISRLDIETSSPVVSFDRESINRTGYQTVSDVIRNLPYQSGFAFDEKFTNSFAPGSSGVSLRGLGQNATLVLINGRRVAAYGFAQNITDAFVDLNSIPLGAIERIDVLKTGASAIYGSDALAGVINVITRRDFEGVTASATISDTSRTDMMEFSGNVAAGVVSQRGNILVTADYYRRSNLVARDRAFSASADQTFREDGIDYTSVWGSPGFIFFEGGFYSLPPADSFATPGQPTEAELRALPPGLASFDYAPFIDLIPRTERHSLSAIGEYDLFDDLTFFTMLSHTKVKTDSLAAPTPDTAFLDDREMAADNPFNPFDFPITYGYRYVDHGSRINDLDTDVTRMLLGLKGTVMHDWNWETAVLWNRSKTTNIGRNYHSDPAVRDALASTDPETALNIFDVNPHLREDLTIETLRVGDSRLQSIDLFVDNGAIFDLPAGSVGFAAGFEYRDEQVEDLADSFSTTGQVVASGGTSADGRRNLRSAYAEFVIPVVDMVEIDAAVRFEDYSDFGNTTKPRVGVRFRPLDWLMLRGVYDEGFRAPSLAQLYLGESTSFPQVNDPLRPSDAGNQIRTVAGGNPDLQPETSEQFYFGFVIEPPAIEGLSVAVDLTRIKHKDIIDDLGVGFIVNNEDDLPGLVVRAPFENNQVDQDAGNTAGPIVFINNTFGNFGDRKTEFVDLEVNYRTDTDLGHMHLFGTITYMADFKQTFRPGEDPVQLAGTNRYPRYRSTVGGTLEHGDFGFTLMANYIHSFNDPSRDGRVGSFIEVNPQVTYSGFWDTRVTLGIQNVFDKRPPWTSDTWEGYEFAVHSPVMRRVYLRVARDF